MSLRAGSTDADTRWRYCEVVLWVSGSLIPKGCMGKMITFDFSDRVAVVTGAGGGMGQQIADLILKSGGSVVMIDLKPEPDDLGGTPDRRNVPPSANAAYRNGRQ